MQPRVRNAYQASRTFSGYGVRSRCREWSAVSQDVKTHAEMWDWLNYTVPAQFWVDEPTSPTLAAYNKLLGYMSIRVQTLGTVTIAYVESQDA